MSDFDFRALYQRSFIPNPCMTYDELYDANLEHYIDEQFMEIDEELLDGMFFDEEAGDANQQPIDQEAVNTFLTRVCGMIGVDPSEAIAQEFAYYSDMVEWLKITYHDRVIDLYEAKLERYYQAICETLYYRCIDNENPPSSDRPQREIAKKVQHIFRTIINSAAWWDSNIVWILDLSDDNATITIANMSMPEEIEDELNRIFLDEELEPKNQA